MRTVKFCFGRRRSYFGTIVLLLVCIVFANLGVFVARGIQQVIVYGSSTPISDDRIQTHATNRVNNKDPFRPIVHQFRKGNPEDVLESPVYPPRKTNFEDAFPPNTKTVSTLHKEVVIGNFDICKGTNHRAYVVVVHSAVKNLERRQSIRSTWGRSNLIQGLPSRTIFLVGQINDQLAQYALLWENELYGDIIQGEFVDSHRNMTLKNAMGLRWLWNYCSNAKVVVKVDDDVFVNIFRARELYFDNLESLPKQIICEVGTKSHIFRIKDFPPGQNSTVSDDYFKGLKWYPMPWCFGFAVFMSMNFTREIYQAALATPAFPIDDVYFYGILPSTIKGTTWRNEDKRFSKYEVQTRSKWSCHRKRSFIVGTFRSKESAQILWNTTLNCLQK